MKKLNVILMLPLWVSAIFISGCSAVPKALQVAENATLTNFLVVRDNANSELGNLARWGGVIAKVTNNADNSMLEIVHFPLKSSAMPKQGNETLGRFRVYFSGLLDPIIYKEGRSITALGTVATSEEGKIGEHAYNYPVLKASHIHLWKDEKQVDVRVIHNPFWSSPSFWQPRYSYYPRRVVVRKAPAPVKKK
ncbi:Slp family lipoprotein [Colwellia hornerae]|uniref:Slp/YeaY family lipoprotein n=1 Tax=Colwellia hornerae TaxID=89402 RepID=A0A5C6QMR1_9GAMM|nr:Slp family lipoprotein [Colwellia hornerae]TWX54551.1 Slp/YeaY family lipoprotein [Colwellia hornerae]TWX60991.1 Slp/YeaY family lipoprotein [Colwellia hornerae]TWX70244.1 Slp/YeaY family lipoprotein [Colwellia hornerae]